MKDVLLAIMERIALIHDAILRLNDSRELYLSDKVLHFLVIGALGMLGILVIYPLFKRLSAKGHVLAIAWIYVFTVLLGLTFAIEIGQKISGTGTMSFSDIVSGVLGFLYMFAVFALIRRLFLLVRRAVRKKKE